MNKKLLAGCALALATPWPAHTLEVEIGAARENLSQGGADWKSTYLEGEHRFGERRVVYAALRHNERFGLKDSDWLTGLYHPLDDLWTLNAEAGGSPRHQVLPKATAALNLHRRLDDGWGIGLGGRHTSYTNADTKTTALSLERYFGAYRAAYTFASTRLDGASASPNHRLQFNRYYGERNTIGISLSHGEEAENVSPGGLLTTDVKAVAVLGRHWLNRDWAISYEAIRHQQGTLYRRQGLHLGLRRAF